MIDKKALAISKSPKYQHLLRTRSCYSWLLTFLVLVVYYGYIYLVAFQRDFMAQHLGRSITTIAIPLGLGVIVFTILITGVYVRRANSEFDRLTQEILQENK